MQYCLGWRLGSNLSGVEEMTIVARWFKMLWSLFSALYQRLCVWLLEDWNFWCFHQSRYWMRYALTVFRSTFDSKIRISESQKTLQIKLIMVCWEVFLIIKFQGLVYGSFYTFCLFYKKELTVFVHFDEEIERLFEDVDWSEVQASAKR